MQSVKKGSHRLNQDREIRGGSPRGGSLRNGSDKWDREERNKDRGSYGVKTYTTGACGGKGRGNVV